MASIKALRDLGWFATVSEIGLEDGEDIYSFHRTLLTQSIGWAHDTENIMKVHWKFYGFCFWVETTNY